MAFLPKPLISQIKGIFSEIHLTSVEKGHLEALKEGMDLWVWHRISRVLCKVFLPHNGSLSERVIGKPTTAIDWLGYILKLAHQVIYIQQLRTSVSRLNDTRLQGGWGQGTGADHMEI
jgi:hypothetical protein